jgi:hypothetical protein
MCALVRLSTAFAATGFAIATLTAAPLASAARTQLPPTVSHDVRLSAVTVPPGGLVVSFLGNQLLYCSLICTSVVRGVATVSGVALQAPATFVTGLQSGDLLKAIGVTAVSVTGPAEAAAADVIFKDGMEVAPRALNAFEVGVVGLLNIVPATTGGLPGVGKAIETAREDTFTALNLPVVADPKPTVMPQGVVQVAVIGVINVGAAVIFPAFNDGLLGAFQIPDAAARTLALTGDPLQAVVAGATTTATVADNAGRVIADSVVTAVSNVRTAIGQSRPDVGKGITHIQKSSTTTTPVRLTVGPPREVLATTQHAGAALGSSHPSREVASKVRRTVRSVVNEATGRAHQSVSSTRRPHRASPDQGPPRATRR